MRTCQEYDDTDSDEGVDEQLEGLAQAVLQEWVNPSKKEGWTGFPEGCQGQAAPRDFPRAKPG